MTKFTDGPAMGKALLLQRSPLFLRAVCDRAGQWDALDQLDDTPQSGESVAVYRLVSNSGHMHIQRSDPKTGRRCGGFYASASYSVLAEQPDESITHDTSRWQAWCTEQAKRENP